MAKTSKKSDAQSKKTAQTPDEPMTSARTQIGEYHLPIEPKPGRPAGSGPPTRRLLVLLSLALGMGAALLVWWLGSNL